MIESTTMRRNTWDFSLLYCVYTDLIQTEVEDSIIYLEDRLRTAIASCLIFVCLQILRKIQSR